MGLNGVSNNNQQGPIGPKQPKEAVQEVQVGADMDGRLFMETPNALTSSINASSLYFNGSGKAVHVIYTIDNGYPKANKSSGGILETLQGEKIPVNKQLNTIVLNSNEGQMFSIRLGKNYDGEKANPSLLKLIHTDSDYNGENNKNYYDTNGDGRADLRILYFDSYKYPHNSCE